MREKLLKVIAGDAQHVVAAIRNERQIEGLLRASRSLRTGPSTPPRLAADFALVGRFQDGSAGQLPPTHALERLVCLCQVKQLDVRM